MEEEDPNNKENELIFNNKKAKSRKPKLSQFFNALHSKSKVIEQFLDVRTDSKTDYFVKVKNEEQPTVPVQKEDGGQVLNKAHKILSKLEKGILFEIPQNISVEVLLKLNELLLDSIQGSNEKESEKLLKNIQSIGQLSKHTVNIDSINFNMGNSLTHLDVMRNQLKQLEKDILSSLRTRLDTNILASVEMELQVLIERVLRKFLQMIRTMNFTDDKMSIEIQTDLRHDQIEQERQTFNSQMEKLQGQIEVQENKMLNLLNINQELKGEKKDLQMEVEKKEEKILNLECIMSNDYSSLQQTQQRQ